MATRRSDRRPAPSVAAEGAATPDAPLVTAQMIRDTEEKIGRMELFALGPDWALQRTVLESAATRLLAQRETLLRRVGADGPPVTMEQIARIQGEIARNNDLLRFPDLTLARWRDDLTRMREDFARSRA